MAYNLTNLSLRELRALRKSTNYIPITGIDDWKYWKPNKRRRRKYTSSSSWSI